MFIGWAWIPLPIYLSIKSHEVDTYMSMFLELRFWVFRTLHRPDVGHMKTHDWYLLTSKYHSMGQERHAKAVLNMFVLSYLLLTYVDIYLSIFLRQMYCRDMEIELPFRHCRFSTLSRQNLPLSTPCLFMYASLSGRHPGASWSILVISVYVGLFVNPKESRFQYPGRM